MSDLRQKIISKAGELDIPMIGFASAESWDNPPFEPWVPEEFRPKAIYPEARTVIVIGLPISLPIVESAPSIHYHELYNNVNLLLDEHAYRLSTFLSEKGHPSIYIPRDGYGSISILVDKPTAFFSHRHAAYLAGLGTFGLNNTLLTKEYGPRVRFASVFTAAEIEAGKPMTKQLCTRCMRCAKACPVKAIPGKEYPQGLIDKRACSERNEGLRSRYLSPCGICIKVCPIGEDRKLFGHTDVSMYDDSERYPEYHKAWRHVQSYGSR
ncbi:MAG TPA: 4Fe-4S binding protein [Methanomassiliicoccales archaeon]|nr:4Fe-4S binding protein [Methanomassiliicoccales archaeon]